jgi:DNA-directed RNA polymerase specialized sigma subunit
MDQKIEKALKDKDIVNIMNKASASFRRQLNEDEIQTCKLNALWKSLLHYDENKGAKFTTYLYNGVRIECIREVKFNKRKHLPLHPNLADKRDPFFETELMDEIDRCPDKELIIDRMNSFTIKEIAEKRNCNRETIRRKIKKSINCMGQSMK